MAVVIGVVSGLLAFLLLVVALLLHVVRRGRTKLDRAKAAAAANDAANAAATVAAAANRDDGGSAYDEEERAREALRRGLVPPTAAAMTPSPLARRPACGLAEPHMGYYGTATLSTTTSNSQYTQTQGLVFRDITNSFDEEAQNRPRLRPRVQPRLHHPPDDVVGDGDGGASPVLIDSSTQTPNDNSRTDSSSAAAERKNAAVPLPPRQQPFRANSNNGREQRLLSVPQLDNSLSGSSPPISAASSSKQPVAPTDDEHHHRNNDDTENNNIRRLEMEIDTFEGALRSYARDGREWTLIRSCLEQSKRELEEILLRRRRHGGGGGASGGRKEGGAQGADDGGGVVDVPGWISVGDDDLSGDTSSGEASSSSMPDGRRWGSSGDNRPGAAENRNATTATTTTTMKSSAWTSKLPLEPSVFANEIARRTSGTSSSKSPGQRTDPAADDGDAAAVDPPLSSFVDEPTKRKRSAVVGGMGGANTARGPINAPDPKLSTFATPDPRTELLRMLRAGEEERERHRTAIEKGVETWYAEQYNGSSATAKTPRRPPGPIPRGDQPSVVASAPVAAPSPALQRRGDSSAEIPIETSSTTKQQRETFAPETPTSPMAPGNGFLSELSQMTSKVRDKRPPDSTPKGHVSTKTSIDPDERNRPTETAGPTQQPNGLGANHTPSPAASGSGFASELSRRRRALQQGNDSAKATGPTGTPGPPATSITTALPPNDSTLPKKAERPPITPGAGFATELSRRAAKERRDKQARSSASSGGNNDFASLLARRAGEIRAHD